MKKETFAMLEMLLCAALWSIAGIFMKFLPWNGFALAGLRSLIAGLTIACYMLLTKKTFTFSRRTLIAGLLTGSVYICFAMANKLTTAANAIVLQFTAPVFILIYSALFFHRKIRRGDLIVVLVVLGGITLFFFDQLGPSSVAGNFVAIAAGMFMAGMFMTVENLDTESRFSAILIAQTYAFLVGLPVVIATRPVLNPVTILSVLALGVFQIGIAYILYIKASEICPALACCLIGAVEPLLNPVWVMIFDGETPGLYALAGGVIVIVAVTAWCIWDGKQTEQQAAQA